MQVFQTFHILWWKVIDNETIQFSYRFDTSDELFMETMKFPWVDLSDYSTEELNSYCDPLAIAVGTSYYKLYPVSEIAIHHIFLTDSQQAYRKTLYQEWLWEFYYTNKIDPYTLKTFSFPDSAQQPNSAQQPTPVNEAEEAHKADKTPKNTPKKPSRTLVMWWGGKDSIVSYELIKRRNNGDLDTDTTDNHSNTGSNNTRNSQTNAADNYIADVFINALSNTQSTDAVSLFTFWRRVYDIHSNTAAITWEDHLFVERTLPIEQFKQRSQRWYYSGHVPITAVISFVSLLVCKVYGFSEVVLSAEKSADEGNIEWKWMTINHQWSKSDQAIRLFQDYTAQYIDPTITFINPFWDAYEWQIAQEFAHHKQYFWAFSSCNRNFHVIDQSPDGRWCKKCPKCLFVYMILRPFLSSEDVTTIWWEELYGKEELLPLAEKIWWFAGTKPFECVGTADESVAMTQKFIENEPKLARLLPITRAFLWSNSIQWQQ